MPVLEAKRRGPCAACSQPIQPGERIHYELATGARHLACSDREPEARRNQHLRSCSLCGALLRPNQGHLTVSESQVEGAWVKHWRATCLDVAGCNERIRNAAR